MQQKKFCWGKEEKVRSDEKALKKFKGFENGFFSLFLFLTFLEEKADSEKRLVVRSLLVGQNEVETAFSLSTLDTLGRYRKGYGTYVAYISPITKSNRKNKQKMVQKLRPPNNFIS